MKKLLRLIVKENATPPALYQRIISGRYDKTASSDIRALVMTAVSQDLDVEGLHERYTGDTRLTIQFTLGSNPALESKLDRVIAETGLSQSKALLRLMTSGWFYKTNPKPASNSIVVDRAAPVTQLSRDEATRKPVEPLHLVAQPKIAAAPIDQALVDSSNKLIDSVMDAFG